jgi:lanosterol synthase
LLQAVQFILDRQNPDGGFATYERRRGPLWLESLNPSEMFGQCMTEQSCVECTGSCLSALARFRASAAAGDIRVDQAISRAVSYLKGQQRSDGSFPAAWGIQFTYSIFFAVEGLRSARMARSDPTLTAAADWLLARQKRDGGWGEHYLGCLTGEYREHPQSQVAMTSWALLALLEILGAEHDAVHRGITWLCRSQEPDGSWPRGAVNGVFFRTAMLDYRLYGVYFPAWAIARYVSYRLSRSPEVRSAGSLGASRGTPGRGEGTKLRGSIPTGSHSSHPPSSFRTRSARVH